MLITSPQVYIVYQGTYYAAEKSCKHIWAPNVDVRNRTKYYWETLTRLKEGDIILHCCHQGILAISLVKQSYHYAKAPTYAKRYIGKQGREVSNLDYTDLAVPVLTTDHIISNIRHRKTYKDSAFNCNGDCVQGYLFLLGTLLGREYIQDILHKNPSVIAYENHLKNL